MKNTKVNKHKFLISALAVLIMASIIFAFVGFTTKSVKTKEELISYARNSENGLVKVKTINGVKLKVMLRPNDLLVEQELGEGTTPDKAEVNRLRDKYNNYLYFILSISADGKDVSTTRLADMQAFSNRIQTLAFGMGEYVFLTNENSDTAYVVDYIYPRTYGLGNSTDLMFVFDKAILNESDYITFNLNDIGLLTGTTRYKFRKKDLLTLPQLIL